MLPQDLLKNPRTSVPSGTFSCSLILYQKASFFNRQSRKILKWMGKMNFDVISSTFKWFSKRTCRLYHARLEKKLFCENAKNIIICRQKFHRVYVRETCFKRFLEFHETVSSNRTLLYFLKLISYFSRQLANHSSAISEGQFTCNFYKCAYTIKKGVF